MHNLAEVLGFRPESYIKLCIVECKAAGTSCVACADSNSDVKKYSKEFMSGLNKQYLCRSTQ